VWLEHSGITEGAAFRRLIGKTQIGGPLNPASVAPIFKRVAQWIGMPARIVDRDCTSRWAEVDANAAAVCGEDQCGEIGNGKSSREVGAGLNQRLRHQVFSSETVPRIVLDHVWKKGSRGTGPESQMSQCLITKAGVDVDAEPWPRHWME
jgi:hypothetical protein